MSNPKPLPPEVPPELEPEWRAFERQVDEYVRDWGNAVRKFWKEKSGQKSKSEPGKK